MYSLIRLSSDDPDNSRHRLAPVILKVGRETSCVLRPTRFASWAHSLRDPNYGSGRSSGLEHKFRSMSADKSISEKQTAMISQLKPAHQWNESRRYHVEHKEIERVVVLESAAQMLQLIDIPIERAQIFDAWMPAKESFQLFHRQQR